MNQKKKVLLINPPETEQSGFSGPPLGLLYLAGSLLKEGVKTEIIDGCLEGWRKVEEKIRDYKPDIVGIPCLTPGRKKAFKVAKIAKNINKNILTVIGGVHPTIMYQQILKNYPFIDICVLGEGEKTLIEIVQGKKLEEIDGISFIKENNVILTKPRKYIEDLDKIPFPAWHLIDLQRYPARGRGIFNGVDLAQEPRVSVIFSRGCIGQCTFCSTWWIWRGWRHRSAKNMVDELELLNKNFKISHFCFADDTLTVDKQSILELCDEIIKRKLKIAFHITTRTDCVDKEMLERLRKAGCYNIAYGIETGSEKLLKEMNKKTEVETAKKAILLTQQVGIKPTILLIAGNVGESIKSINQTTDLLKEMNIKQDEIGSVGGLWILPGTKLYFDCKKAGFIDDNFWLSDKPYKIYTLEHNKLALSMFNFAIRTQGKLSKNKFINFIKIIPFIIKSWLKENIKINAR